MEWNEWYVACKTFILMRNNANGKCAKKRVIGRGTAVAPLPNVLIAIRLLSVTPSSTDTRFAVV